MARKEENHSRYIIKEKQLLSLRGFWGVCLIYNGRMPEPYVNVNFDYSFVKTLEPPPRWWVLPKVDGLDKADRLTKRELIRTLVKQVDIGEKEVKIVFRVTSDPFDVALTRALQALVKLV